jgi:hypothetical protein
LLRFTAAAVIFVLLGLLGVIAWRVYTLQPGKWEPAQQVALAAAFITLAGTILSIVGKWFFDHISIDTKHIISVREKILERFYKYAGNYLVPLATAAGQLSTHLAQFRNATDLNDSESAKEALHATLFYVGRYIHIQYQLGGELIPQNSDAPEGIFLESHESEALMWALMVPSWVFGLQTLEEESLLVEKLTTNKRVEFLGLLDDPQSPVHRLTKDLAAALKEDWPNKITDLSNALDSFNQILAYDLTVVYRPWYRRSTPYPRHALAAVLAIPEDRRKQIGIFYRYPTKWAETKAYTWWSRRFRTKASKHSA